MIRVHSSQPPIIEEALKNGFKVFLSKDMDLNIIGARNPEPRPDEFDDLLHVVYKLDGKYIETIFPATLDAGKHWMENPSRSDGTAVLIHPYQYRSAFTFGMHKGQYDCLVQRKEIPVWREKDLDLEIDEHNPSTAWAIQIHRAASHERSSQVGRYSAGCLVIQTGFSEFMDLCRQQKTFTGSSIFSLTILEGRYL